MAFSGGRGADEAAIGLASASVAGSVKETSYKPRGDAPPTLACVGEIALHMRHLADVGDLLP